MMHDLSQLGWEALELARDPSSAIPWGFSQFWRHPASQGMKGLSNQGPSIGGQWLWRLDLERARI